MLRTRNLAIILATLLMAAGLPAAAQQVKNGSTVYVALGGAGSAQQVVNAVSTGTTVNLLAKISTGSNGGAVLATTTDTAVPVYIVTSGAGTSGNATLAYAGQALCIIDSTNASGVRGQYVYESTTTNGQCKISSTPIPGSFQVGTMADDATTSGSTANVQVSPSMTPLVNPVANLIDSGYLQFTEGSNLQANCASGKDFLWGGSASHVIQMCFNGNGAVTLPYLTSGGGFVNGDIVCGSSTAVGLNDCGTIPANTVVTLAGSQTLTNKTLTAPALGAATATSLVATGIVDGTSPVTVEGGSATPCPTGTHCAMGGTYASGYYFLQPTTASSANYLNLPATAVGKQYCVFNSTTGSAPVTGIISITVPASSFFIYKGTIGTVSSTFTSAGAAGDAACFVATDATHWTASVMSGTWTAN